MMNRSLYKRPNKPLKAVPTALTKARIEYALEQIGSLEPHTGLCDTIRARFEQLGHNISVINQCVLEHSKELDKADFTRVIMNPPFRTVKQHITAALAVLKEGGVLIALVPISYQHERAVMLEELGADIFASTKVRTKIIRIIK